MDTSIARRNILARIRAAQGVSRSRAAAEREAAADYLARHPAGPRPEIAGRPRRALHRRSAANWPPRSTRSPALERRAGRGASLPRATCVAAAGHRLANAAGSALGRSRPPSNFASRKTATWSVSPAAFAPIAETGSLVLLSGPETYASAASAAGNAYRHRAGFAHRHGSRRGLRTDPQERGELPRAVNFVSRAVAYRGYRTDHRARRAWAVSGACDRRAGRLSGKRGSRCIEDACSDARLRSNNKDFNSMKGRAVALAWGSRLHTAGRLAAILRRPPRSTARLCRRCGGLPFAGMLLSIAVFPLIAPAFWHHHFGKIAAAWALVFLVPFALSFGSGVAFGTLVHALLEEYIPFIVLLAALVHRGGRHLRARQSAWHAAPEHRRSSRSARCSRASWARPARRCC